MITLPKRPAPMARHIANVERPPKMAVTEAQLGRLMALEAERARGGRPLPSKKSPACNSQKQIDIRAAKIVESLNGWMTQKQIADATGFARSTVAGDLWPIVKDGRVVREMRKNPETNRPIYMYRRADQ